MIGRQTRKRRTENASVRGTLLKAAGTIGVVVLFVAFAVTANKGVPGRKYKTVYVEASKSGSLREHDKVSIGGVRVGQVVTVTPRDTGSRIKMQINPGVDIPTDTKVMLRANGLLGARYVQLIPGKSDRAVGSGATLKTGEDALTYGVPDALDIFNKKTRGSLGTAVDGLGTGTMGNGEILNDGVGDSSQAVGPFGAIMRSISARTGAARNLAPALDSAMVPLAGSRKDIRSLFDPAATTLDAFADEHDQIRDTLAIAPGAMSTATTGLQHGQALLGAVDQLAVSAHRTLPTAPAGLKRASALLRQARTDTGGGSPLKRTTRLLSAAKPAVPAALKITRSLDPVLPRVTGALEPLSPIAQHLGRFGCDTINAGVMLRSMTGMVGTGEGPNGPSSQFRAQGLGAPETLGFSVNQIHDAYHAPCKYVGHEFNVPGGSAVTPKTRRGH